MAAYRHVLCALDFSPAADAALDEAIELALRFGARLELVHVWTPPVDLTPEQLAVPASAYDDRAARAALDVRLERARAMVAGGAVAAHLVHGPPARGILETARALGADLIVMGTHRRRGLAHLVLGSVAEQVVRAAPCPVLTVRAPG